MELWGITNNGKVRRENQDVFKIFQDEEKGFAVLVVCDGMGGANAGNVASAVAAETFIAHIDSHVEGFSNMDNIAEIMINAVHDANKTVYEKSILSEKYAGMGTTLTAAISASEGEVIVNIGDSRVYHITQNSIKQVTIDHSVVEDMISRGDLTRAEARRHPNKNLITRALGSNNHEQPDVFKVNLSEGEYLLLCSDGLSNVVFDSELLFELQHSTGVKESCEKLIETALERGAPDNVTAVIFKK
jgi:protein phosphatase